MTEERSRSGIGLVPLLPWLLIVARPGGRRTAHFGRPAHIGGTACGCTGCAHRQRRASHDCCRSASANHQRHCRRATEEQHPNLPETYATENNRPDRVSRCRVLHACQRDRQNDVPVILAPGALIEVPVSAVRALAIEESITAARARLPDWNVPPATAGFPSGPAIPVRVINSIQI